jgi:hypothetical protein
MRFVLHPLCILVPQPLPIPMFPLPLPWRCVAVADALSGMDNVNVLLLLFFLSSQAVL